MENVLLFEDKKIVALYADGGVIGKNPSDFGGTFGWVAVDANDEIVTQGSGFHQTEGQQTTNNHTELIAAIEALEAMAEGWSGTFYSDSKITLGRLFQGWRCKNVPVDYIIRFKCALARLGDVKGSHVDGHASKKHLEAGIGKRGNPVSKWNNFVDNLCNQEKLKVTGKTK